MQVGARSRIFQSRKGGDKVPLPPPLLPRKCKRNIFFNFPSTKTDTLPGGMLFKDVQPPILPCLRNYTFQGLFKLYAQRTIQIEACLFNPTFHRRSHSKGPKERALHVHQTKTKHFIAKLVAQPIDARKLQLQKYSWKQM